MIVARDKRITAKHIRELAEAGIKTFSVNEFILGRVLAEDVVASRPAKWWRAPMTRLPKAAREAARASVTELRTLYLNDLDRGAYISQTLRRRCRRPVGRARWRSIA